MAAWRFDNICDIIRSLGLVQSFFNRDATIWRCLNSGVKYQFNYSFAGPGKLTKYSPSILIFLALVISCEFRGPMRWKRWIYATPSSFHFLTSDLAVALPSKVWPKYFHKIIQNYILRSKLLEISNKNITHRKKQSFEKFLLKCNFLTPSVGRRNIT